MASVMQSIDVQVPVRTAGPCHCPLASNTKEVGMADSDAARSAVPKKADAGANGTAPMTSAPDPGREQGRGDTQGNAVQEAEREQERQLAEGTESPG
jgi:hypothetical protein